MTFSLSFTGNEKGGEVGKGGNELFQAQLVKKHDPRQLY